MTDLTQPIIHSNISTHSIPISECVSQTIITIVLNQSIKTIKRKQYLIKNLSNFASQKSIKSINEVSGMHLKEMNKNEQICCQEDQPKALIIDSLLPISADINEQNEYRNRLMKKDDQSNAHILSVKKKQKINSQVKDDVYTKLNLQEGEEEDGFTRQLRKMQEEKTNKIENELKAKENEEKARIAKLKQKKDKKSQKEEKISYDYNGEVFTVRNDAKSNLISSIVNDKINSITRTIKKALDDANPTTVESTKNKKDLKRNQVILSKRSENIEFSEMKSLAENVKIATGGIKYSHNSIVIEEKRQAMGVVQLRRSLSTRRLSMDQYKKIKSLTGDREQFDESLRKSQLETSRQSTLQIKSQSEGKLGASKLSKIKKSTIIINNEDLRESLLEEISKISPAPYLQPEEQAHLENTFPKLDSIDNYNIDYLRTKGTLNQENHAKDNFSNTLKNKLPKIVHTSLQTKTMPKNRQKVKDSVDIIREIRKKFEEKLRI